MKVDEEAMVTLKYRKKDLCLLQYINIYQFCANKYEAIGRIIKVRDGRCVMALYALIFILYTNNYGN